VQQNVKRDDPGRGKVIGCSTKINRKEFKIPSRVGFIRSLKNGKEGSPSSIHILWLQLMLVDPRHTSSYQIGSWFLKLHFCLPIMQILFNAETFKIPRCSNCSNPYLLRCSESPKIVKDADRRIFVQLVYLNTWNPIIHLIATELSTKAYSPPIMLLPWPSSPFASFQCLVS
jgi:hypothetical protein